MSPIDILKNIQTFIKEIFSINSRIKEIESKLRAFEDIRPADVCPACGKRAVRIKTELTYERKFNTYYRHIEKQIEYCTSCSDYRNTKSKQEIQTDEPMTSKYIDQTSIQITDINGW